MAVVGMSFGTGPAHAQAWKRSTCQNGVCLSYIQYCCIRDSNRNIVQEFAGRLSYGSRENPAHHYRATIWIASGTYCDGVCPESVGSFAGLGSQLQGKDILDELNQYPTLDCAQYQLNGVLVDDDVHLNMANLTINQLC